MILRKKVASNGGTHPPAFRQLIKPFWSTLGWGYWEWTSKIEEKYMTIIIAVILTAYILSITKLESTG